MPITTKSASALVSGGSSLAGSDIKIRLLKQTRINSLGRNAAVGEEVFVSETDARFLCSYKYAERCRDEEVKAVEEGGKVEDAKPEVKHRRRRHIK